MKKKTIASLLLLLALPMQTNGAIVATSVDLRVSYSPPPQGDYQSRQGPYDSSGNFLTEATTNISANNSGRSASGYSYASAGILKLLVSSSVPRGSDGGAEAHASASFTDFFTLSSSLFNGQHGRLTGEYLVSGSQPMLELTQSYGPGFIGVGAELVTRFQSGSGTESKSQIWNINYNPYVGDSQQYVSGYDILNKMQTVSIDFVYGQPIFFSLTIEARSSARLGLGNDALASAASTFDLSHTVEWQGFGSVLNPSGLEDSTYQYSSESGINYALPIPEPNSAFLFATGLFAIWHRRKY